MILISAIFIVSLLMPIMVSGLIAMPPGDSIYLDHNQQYSIYMDGEGETIVSLSVYFQAFKNGENKNTYLLEIPYSEVQVLGVYERVLKSGGKCIEWGNTCVKRGQGSTCTEYDYNGNCLSEEAPCLEYKNACINYDNYNRVYEYEKIDITPQVLSDKTILNINFQQPDLNDQKELIVAVKIYDAVDKSLGKFSSKFKTFSTDRMINYVNVGVGIPSEYILKHGNARVNYRPEILQYADVIENSYKISADEMRGYTSIIQRSQQYYVGESYLDTFETMTVNLQYSKTWFALYWPTLIWVLISIGIAATGIVFAVKKLKEKLKNAKKKEHVGLVSFLGGLLICVGISVFWGIIILLNSLITRAVFYEVQMILVSIIGLIGFLVTMGLMIGVPIYVGKKYNPKTGFYLALWTFAWLFVFGIIASIIMASGARF